MFKLWQFRSDLDETKFLPTPIPSWTPVHFRFLKTEPTPCPWRRKLPAGSCLAAVVLIVGFKEVVEAVDWVCCGCCCDCDCCCCSVSWLEWEGAEEEAPLLGSRTVFPSPEAKMGTCFLWGAVIWKKRMNEWMNVCESGHLSRWIYEWMVGWTDGHAVGVLGPRIEALDQVK